MNFKFEKELYIKRILFLILISITAVFQNTPVLPVLGNAHAWVLIPLVVSIAMNEKSVPSMFFGILAGVLWDFASEAIDGYYAIVFCVIAFTCSMLVNFVMRNNIMSALLLSFVAVGAVTLLNWLLFVVFKHYGSNSYTLLNYYIPSGVYTFVFTPISYYITLAISKRFKTDSRAINS